MKQVWILTPSRRQSKKWTITTPQGRKYTLVPRGTKTIHNIMTKQDR